MNVAEPLEVTFKSILDAAPALAGVTIRQGGEVEERSLPAVVIVAEETGDNLAIDIGGVYARDGELKFVCKLGVSATPAECAALYANVKAAVESAVIASGWSLLHLDEQVEDEKDMQDKVREYSLVYSFTALPE